MKYGLMLCLDACDNETPEDATTQCERMSLGARTNDCMMSDADYKAYDASLDLNGDGIISSADYAIANNDE